MSALAGATVIFDLDGTMVDTAPDLVRALNHVMDEDGFPHVPIEDVRAMVGRGSRALLMRGYARCGAALPHDAVSLRVGRFLEAYAADIAARSRPFPGLFEALDALEGDGARAVIATNKPQALTDQLLDALSLRARFVRAVGADAARAKKPDARHLVDAVGPEGDITRAVMVGDSDVDVAAARAAATPVIVMTHGYSETPVERLGADRVIAGFGELHDAAASLLAR